MSMAMEHISVVAARVKNAGPVLWLIEGLWIDLQYGAFGGNEKAQKTWTAEDLAVSVASKTKFLDNFQVEVAGPVMYYTGEGGERSAVRRLRAVCESRGLVLEDLPIYLRARAPHLNDDGHMDQFVQDVSIISPILVVLDPYYLSASGSDMRDLVSQGGLLERPQHICVEAGASLLIVHHFNQGEGLTTSRFSGTGLAQWARVLGMFEVKSSRTDPATKASEVTIAAKFKNGEGPDLDFTIKRRIYADDPGDANSPLHYEVQVFENEAPSTDGMKAVTRKVLESLTAVGPATSKVLVDWIAGEYGHGLKTETMNRELSSLNDAGLADSYGTGWTAEWFLVEQETGTAA
jgi:hypothetical protein